MIEFGKQYRDIVSGFEGICTGMVEWMYGCKQYILSPKAETASKKEHSSLFFEKQLEFIDDGIADKVEAPVIGEQRFFGRECVDKVTGVRGMCIGRYIWLFNCDQYVLEFQPDARTKETKFNILDEGRVEIAPNPSKEVRPEDVASPRSGGILSADTYPQTDIPMM